MSHHLLVAWGEYENQANSHVCFSLTMEETEAGRVCPGRAGATLGTAFIRRGQIRAPKQVQHSQTEFPVLRSAHGLAAFTAACNVLPPRAPPSAAAGDLGQPLDNVASSRCPLLHCSVYKHDLGERGLPRSGPERCPGGDQATWGLHRPPAGRWRGGRSRH